jgi:hypothetical protein
MLGDDSVKLSSAFQELEQVMGRELTPEIIKLAGVMKENMPQIKQFIQAIGDAAAYLIENPFKGIGIIIAAAVAKDVAMAGIGSVIRNAITGGGGGALGGAAGGAGARTILGGAAAAAGWAGGVVAIDEGMQWAEQKASELTGQNVKSSGLLGTMTGMGPAIDSLNAAASSKDAPEWVRGLAAMVRDPIDTLMGDNAEFQKGLLTQELKVRIMNPDALNRTNSPTQPR